MPTGSPAMCSTVTVFSLSVNPYVRAPPSVRNEVSRQAGSLGNFPGVTNLDMSIDEDRLPGACYRYRNRAIELAESFYRADRYDFSFSIHRERG